MRNNNENSVRKRCTQPFSFSIEGANVFVLPCAIFNAWHIVRGARVDSYMRQWHTGTMLRNFTTELQTILCAPQYLQFSDAFGTVSASRAYCSQAMWREREGKRNMNFPDIFHATVAWNTCHHPFNVVTGFYSPKRIRISMRMLWRSRKWNWYHH